MVAQDVVAALAAMQSHLVCVPSVGKMPPTCAPAATWSGTAVETARSADMRQCVTTCKALRHGYT